MGENPNLGLLRLAYDAFARRDVATLRELASEDIIWHVPGIGLLSGDYKGSASVLTLFARSAEMTAGMERIEVHDTLANDEHGVALTRYTASRQGKQLDVLLVNVFHIRDGKITEVWDFLDDQRTYDEFWS